MNKKSRDKKPLAIFRDNLRRPRCYLDSVYRALKERGATAPHGDTTILHKACELGNLELVQACLDYGQDLFKRDVRGQTALWYGFDRFGEKLLQLLYPNVPSDRLYVTAFMDERWPLDERNFLLKFLPRGVLEQMLSAVMEDSNTYSSLFSRLLQNSSLSKGNLRETVVKKMMKMKFSKKLADLILLMFDHLPLKSTGMEVLMIKFVALDARSIRRVNRHEGKLESLLAMLDQDEKKELLLFIDTLDHEEVFKLLPDLPIPKDVFKEELVPFAKELLDGSIDLQKYESLLPYNFIYPGVDDPALLKEQWELHSESLFQYFTDLIEYFFYYPDLTKQNYLKETTLNSIEIQDNGHAANGWEEFCESLLLQATSAINRIRPSPLMNQLRERLEMIKGEEPEQGRSTSWLQAQTFVKSLGRTDLYRNAETGMYTAVKWQKKGESVDELMRECETVRFFKKHQRELGLKSVFPEPIGVFEFYGKLRENHFQDHQVPIVAENRSKRRFAYIYTFPNNSYFTYLHDKNISDEEFQKGRLAALNDLFKLASQKFLMTSLADIFHNSDSGRDDGGRYLPFPGLFMGGWRKGRGSGRLERGVYAPIEYVNERKSGIADVGDFEFLDVLNDPSFPLMRRSFAKIFKVHEREITEVLLMANFLAEYHLVDELVLGRRKVERGELDWQNMDSVANLAESLQKGTNIAYSAFTGLSERVVSRFTQKCGVDWERYARQIAFWVMNNEKGYLPHVKAGTIPLAIYGSETKVTVAPTSRLRGWDDQRGFFYTNQPDLGTVNGPYPIKEGEKNRNLMVVFMTEIYSGIARAKDLTSRGDEAFAKEDYLKARKHYERSLSYNRYSAKTFSLLAKTHRALGNDKLADVCWKQYTALMMQQNYDKKKELT